MINGVPSKHSRLVLGVGHAIAWWVVGSLSLCFSSDQADFWALSDDFIGSRDSGRSVRVCTPRLETGPDQCVPARRRAKVRRGRKC